MLFTHGPTAGPPYGQDNKTTLAKYETWHHFLPTSGTRKSVCCVHTFLDHSNHERNGDGEYLKLTPTTIVVHPYLLLFHDVGINKDGRILFRYCRRCTSERRWTEILALQYLPDQLAKFLDDMKEYPVDRQWLVGPDHVIGFAIPAPCTDGSNTMDVVLIE